MWPLVMPIYGGSMSISVRAYHGFLPATLLALGLFGPAGAAELNKAAITITLPSEVK
jgi:hypothetical protein